MENSKENKIRFAMLLGKLGMAFGSAPDKETMAVYFEFLSDRSFYQVESAITQLIQTGDRFPSVAKIREIASSYREMKTAEVSNSVQIEEFTTASGMPHTPEDFFKLVADLGKGKGI